MDKRATIPAAAEEPYAAIVLGATGNVGGRIVQHLILDFQHIRTIVRKSSE
jgi:lipoprotein signal peptidase